MQIIPREHLFLTLPAPRAQECIPTLPSNIARSPPSLEPGFTQDNWAPTLPLLATSSLTPTLTSFNCGKQEHEGTQRPCRNWC